MTNCDDWAEPNRLANSTASSMATRGGVSLCKQLVGPQPQDVPVGGRHPLQAPMGGGLLEQGVQLLPMLPHAGHQLPREAAEVVAPQAALDELIAHRRVAAGIQVVLVEDLEGDFPGSAAAGHGEG